MVLYFANYTYNLVSFTELQLQKAFILEAVAF